MMLARVHVRVAIHIIKCGALKYKWNCCFLLQETWQELQWGLWEPSELPLCIVRRGDVKVGIITHTDFIVRPDVVLKWLDKKVLEMPAIYQYPTQASRKLSFDPSQGSWMGCPVVDGVVNVASQVPNIEKETDIEVEAVLSQLTGRSATKVTPPPSQGTDKPKSPSQVTHKDTSADFHGQFHEHALLSCAWWGVGGCWNEGLEGSFG